VPAILALQPKPKAKVHFMSQPEARKFEVTCSSCNLREVCLPGGLCARTSSACRTWSTRAGA
jgi:hypothetical protein